MLCIEGLQFLVAKDYQDDKKIVATLVVDALPSKTKVVFIYCRFAAVSDCGKVDIVPTLY